VIKLVFAINRRSDVDEAEFHRYWLEDHGPLVRSFQEALQIRRYVQSHRIDTPVNDALRASRNTAGPYDGMAELWWDSIDALAAVLGTPEGQAASTALLEDEAKFIDFASASIWMSEEHEIIPLT
jgi:uncharacterized protein (TIGR02118 family)